MNDAYAALGRRAGKDPSQCVKPFAISPLAACRSSWWQARSLRSDKQLIPVEEHLERLVEKYIPEEDREGFVFHAVDIWNNHGYFADKRVWPREKCWEILWDLASVPALFVLPIAVGLKLRPEVADWIRGTCRESKRSIAGKRTMSACTDWPSSISPMARRM